MDIKMPKFPEKDNQLTYSKLKKSKEMQDITSDPRFAHVAFDPKYRTAKKQEIKVQIDNRFKLALTNDRFNTEPFLDPRGKPKNYSTKEKLNKFYELESSSDSEKEESDKEESEEENLKIPEKKIQRRKNKLKEKDKLKEKNKLKETHSEENTATRDNFLEALLDPERDLARGEMLYSDDSSDDDSTTTEEDEEEQFAEFEWAELDGDAQWDRDGVEVEETNRFAVCDMDWDRVKAVDLMVLFSSFAPPSGTVKKVSIFPSEFGKTRMKEEERMGPQELVRLLAGNKKGTQDDLEHLQKVQKGMVDDEGTATALQTEALRRYQRNRLRYFYAVVECDSVSTATAIYKDCDRTPYEVAGVTLDLRYIPNEMEFEEVPHDECHQVPESYESENFQTTALLDSKPTLTWDEPDQRRKKTLSAAMAKASKREDFNQDALKAYVAMSDSSSEEESEKSENESEGEGESGEDTKRKEERIARFRSLISEIEEKEKHKIKSEFELEEEEEGEEEEGEGEGEEGEGEEGGGGKKTQDGETPFEKFLEKRRLKKKERRKKKKEGEEEEGEEVPQTDAKKKKLNDTSSQGDTELSLLMMEEEEAEKNHFDMRVIRKKNEMEDKKKKKKKNRNKKRAEEEEEVEESAAKDFQVDPSDPRFSALFSHGDFHLDPSHTMYDPHSSLNALVSKTAKRKREQRTDHQQGTRTDDHPDSELSSLVKKIRSKTSRPK